MTTSWVARVRPTSLAGRLAALSAAMLLAAGLATPLALQLAGGLGLAAMALAAVACGMGAALALGIAETFTGPLQPLFAACGGMFARLAIPLAACAAVQWRGGPLADAGLLYYAIVFYLVGVAVDTVLILPAGSAASAGKGVPNG